MVVIGRLSRLVDKKPTFVDGHARLGGMGQGGAGFSSEPFGRVVLSAGQRSSRMTRPVRRDAVDPLARHCCGSFNTVLDPPEELFGNEGRGALSARK